MCKGCQQPYRVAVIRKDGEAISKPFDDYGTAMNMYRANKEEPSVYLMAHTMASHGWVTLAFHNS